MPNEYTDFPKKFLISRNQVNVIKDMFPTEMANNIVSISQKTAPNNHISFFLNWNKYSSDIAWYVGYAQVTEVNGTK